MEFMPHLEEKGARAAEKRPTGCGGRGEQMSGRVLQEYRESIMGERG